MSRAPGTDGARAADRSGYTAADIVVLPGLEAVRRRPSMYVGSTGLAGVHHLVLEVVGNAIDEAMAGHCTQVSVTVWEDGSCSVEDDGRGIPVDPHPATGRPACEVVLTTLHAGGKFAEGPYGVSGGLHGVGLSCVNALSRWLVLDVRRDGRHHRQRFERGAPTQDLQDLGADPGRGTRVHFLPDPEVFGDARLGADAVLARRLQEQAFLHPGVAIRFDLRPAGTAETYQYDTGVAGFVAWLNRARTAVHPEPVRVRGAWGRVDVDAALQWTTAYAEDTSTYVNSVFTPQGGTHLEGLNAALNRAVNRYAAEHGLVRAGAGEAIAGYDVREGLTAVLSVRMPSPEFEGQTKSALTSPDALDAVEQVVGAGLARHLEASPEVAAAIVGKALEASRARAAARRASERARYQAVDAGVSKEVYRQQFGIRSVNWHESARWITDSDLLAAHAAACRVGRDARVLDACCGSGVVGASFRDRVGEVVGVDLTREMRDLARTRLDRVVEGDVYDLPFPDASFDLVVNREVLHLLPRPDRPLSEMRRVLRPGGQVIVGQLVPYGPVDAPWMFRVLKKKQPLFFNNFLEEDLRGLLLATGFVDVQVTEHLQWEDIDTWIDTHETPNLHRHEIRDLYHHAPAEVRAVHPFEVLASGAIRDCWRWCVFSAFRPLDGLPG